MKKLLFIAFFGLLSAGLVNAQAYDGSGDQKVSVGLVPWGYGSGLSIIYDHGLSDVISVGGGGEFYFGGDNSSDFYIFGRANFHLGEMLSMPTNMDLYPGIDIGINDGIGLGAHLGFRYLFTEKIGAFIEAGSRGSLGVVINL